MFQADIHTWFMFASVKQFLFGRWKSSASTQRSIADASLLESVPQFPPFQRGFPIVPADAVLQTQDALLVQIRDMLGFSLTEHARLVEPILQRFAEYVHLLPASQIHHHRGTGGLLRHGLEVALWAGQASKAVVFPYDGPPRHKHEHRARWRLAFFLAGLTHDVGKPVTDMQITDASGNHIWEPYGPSVIQWSQAHGIDRYFIRWVTNRRHKQHESGGLLIANRILGEGTISYLSRYDNQLMPALTRVMSGTAAPDERLMRAVMLSDRHSVSLDMKANRLEINGYAQGIPVEQHVVEIIRQLTTQQVWSSNTPDATVWHLPEGAFVRWDEAVKDINRLVGQMEIPGVPKDPQVLADILIERGIAVGYEQINVDGEVLAYRYHRLTDGKRTIYALRFSHAEYVFDEPTPPVLKDIMFIQDERSNPGAAPEASTPQGPTGTTPPAALQSGTTHESSEEATPTEKIGTQNGDMALDAIKTKPSVQRVPLDLDGLINAMVEREGPPPPLPEVAELESIGEDKDASAATTLRHDDSPNGDTSSEGSGQTPPQQGIAHSTPESSVDKGENRKRKGKADSTPASKPTVQPRLESASASVIEGCTVQERASVIQGRAAVSESVPSAVAGDKTAAPVPSGITAITGQVGGDDNCADSAMNALTAMLGALGRAGEHLNQLLGPIFARERVLGQDVLKLPGGLYIAYPAGLERLGNAMEILGVLSAAGVLTGDPLFPNKKVREVEGQRVVRFQDKLGNAIEAAIEEVMDLDDPFLGTVSDERQQHLDLSVPRHRSAATLAAQKQATITVTPKHSGEHRGGVVQTPPAYQAGEESTDAKSDVAVHNASVSLSQEDNEVPSATARSLLDDAHVPDADVTPEPVLKGPPAPTMDAVLKDLKDMMLEGTGRWLIDPVQRDGQHLVVPKNNVVKSIVLEYPNSMSASKLRLGFSMKKHGFIVKNNRIHLFLGDQK